MVTQEDKKEKQIEGVCFENLVEAYKMGYSGCLNDMKIFINKMEKRKDKQIETFINKEYKSVNV
jgi:S-adenosylmethionine:tRNA-ribosyltransferase-isomerase (queuine synthetase)